MHFNTLGMVFQIMDKPQTPCTLDKDHIFVLANTYWIW